MVSLVYKKPDAVKAESYCFEIHITDIYGSSYAINEHSRTNYWPASNSVTILRLYQRAIFHHAS